MITVVRFNSRDRQLETKAPVYAWEFRQIEGVPDTDDLWCRIDGKNDLRLDNDYVLTTGMSLYTAPKVINS